MKENDRVSYLKQLTKVFFRAIFDGFNEALESQRAYGFMGQPYPWTKNRISKPQINLRKAFNYAYKKILSYSVVFCGVHFVDKSHSLSPLSIS